jgi:uncharacterized protein (DUF2141 family)
MALAASTLGALAADLTVTVEGVTVEGGPVLVALFDNPNGFPAGQAKAEQSAAPAQATLVFTFKNLPPGNYALSAFQDRNKNQRLDVSMMGMPTEPYGFSRDARSHAGPPRFKDAMLSLGTESSQTRIPLR